MEKAKSIFKQAFPWIVTVSILAYVFGTQDYRKIGSAFSQANLKLYIPCAIAILITTYNLDCLSQWLCLKWFCAPVRYRDVMIARGVSFLLMIINFNLGQGGMVYFFYRLTGKSLKRVAGAFFFTVFGDLYSFVTLFTIAIFFVSDMPQLQRVLIIGCSSAWLYWILSFCYWRAGWHKKFLKGMSEWEILSSFKEASFAQYLAIYLIRAPIFFLIVLLFYLAMISFGGKVPLVVFMVRMPIVMLVSGLPIAIAGLGPTQLGWHSMFGEYTSKELGTSLSLAWNFAMIVVNATIALICLPFGKNFLSVIKEKQKEEAAYSSDSQHPTI